MEFRRKNLFWDIKFNKYNLLKKPINGGTPASENKKTVIKNIKKLSKLNILNEYSVFSCEFRNDINTQNKPKSVKL